MVAISDVGSTLNDLQVDPEVVKSILDMLDSSKDALGPGLVHEVPESAFGPAPAAVELAVNTAKAHAKVAKAMDEMMLGIGQYADVLRRFRDEALAADDNTVVAMSSLNQATSCVATPAISDAGTCTIEGS